MFKLSAATPEKIVFEKNAISVLAPGMLGYLGILTDHAPLITPLVPGRLEVKEPGGVLSRFFISGGFLEVSKNVVTILADAIEKPDEIDIERAKSAEMRAKERLQHRNEGKIDIARAEGALQRAIWRQKIAHQTD
jgi:F-type H+-transporting ATPase subunit epsilon